MLDTTWFQQWSSWCCCHCHQSLSHYFVFYFKFEFLDGWAAAWAARQMHRSYNTLQQTVGGDTVCHPDRFWYVVNATVGQPHQSGTATLCPAVVLHVRTLQCSALCC